MQWASGLALATATVAFFSALYHGWLYHLRRWDTEHLWLAISALGVVAVSGTQAMLYGAASVEQGELWQRWMFVASTPILVGFLRFSFCFLGVWPRWLDRAGLLFAAVVVSLCLGTDRVFDGTPVPREIGFLGAAFVESGIDAVGYAVMVTFFAFFGAAVALHARQLPRHAAARSIFPNLCVWLVTGTSDGLVAAGLYSGPYLLVLGYVAVLAGISRVLFIRFVRSADDLERFASEMHEMVEARTEELRQKDLQLAHGERLATLGTLAASVAHEINNPIAFVHSNLNRLEELYEKPEAGDETREILAECRQGTERVRAIVANLLDLARRGERDAGPVDLAEVIGSILPLVRSKARSRARIVTRLAKVPAVLGDATLLGQVVLNLVVNALEAIPEDAPERNQVTISTHAGAGVVRLEVADTGVGIDPALADRVFEPFFTTKPDGTGLGLAVSRQIVSRYRGRIDVRREDGVTRMVVELPAAG
jgi:signal transduction histidine kinase